MALPKLPPPKAQIPKPPKLPTDSNLKKQIELSPNFINPNQVGKLKKSSPPTNFNKNVTKKPSGLEVEKLTLNQKRTNNVVSKLNRNIGNGGEKYTSRAERRKAIRNAKAPLIASNKLNKKKFNYTKKKNNIARTKKEAYDKKIAAETAADTAPLINKISTNAPVIPKVVSPPIDIIVNGKKISILVGEITKPGDGEVPKTKKQIRANITNQKQKQKNITIRKLLNVQDKLANVESKLNFPKVTANKVKNAANKTKLEAKKLQLEAKKLQLETTILSPKKQTISNEAKDKLIEEGTKKRKKKKK